MQRPMTHLSRLGSTGKAVFDLEQASNPYERGCATPTGLLEAAP
jgi:hypothetical protein